MQIHILIMKNLKILSLIIETYLINKKDNKMNKLKERIELLTIIKMILEIDGRKSDWKEEDELELIKLKCKYYKINITN